MLTTVMKPTEDYTWMLQSQQFPIIIDNQHPPPPHKKKCCTCCLESPWACLELVFFNGIKQRHHLSLTLQAAQELIRSFEIFFPILNLCIPLALLFVQFCNTLLFYHRKQPDVSFGTINTNLSSLMMLSFKWVGKGLPFAITIPAI